MSHARVGAAIRNDHARPIQNPTGIAATNTAKLSSVNLPGWETLGTGTTNARKTKTSSAPSALATTIAIVVRRRTRRSNAEPPPAATASTAARSPYAASMSRSIHGLQRRRARQLARQVQPVPSVRPVNEASTRSPPRHGAAMTDFLGPAASCSMPAPHPLHKAASALADEAQREQIAAVDPSVACTR